MVGVGRAFGLDSVEILDLAVGYNIEDWADNFVEDSSDWADSFDSRYSFEVGSFDLVD